MINTVIIKLQFKTGEIVWIPWRSRDAFEQTKPDMEKYLAKSKVFNIGKVPFTELPEELQHEIRETLSIFNQSYVYYEYGRFSESPNACIKSHYELDHFFVGTYTQKEIRPLTSFLEERDKMNTPEITSFREWRGADVRHACIENDLYCCGTNDEYYAMLHMVDSIEPSAENIYLIAKDIQEHSKLQTITNIMYILENDVVKTFYRIDGKD